MRGSENSCLQYIQYKRLNIRKACKESLGILWYFKGYTLGNNKQQPLQTKKTKKDTLTDQARFG